MKTTSSAAPFAAPAADYPILAIDLGKYKSVACVDAPASSAAAA